MICDRIKGKKTGTSEYTDLPTKYQLTHYTNKVWKEKKLILISESSSWPKIKDHTTTEHVTSHDLFTATHNGTCHTT